jgi:hypothetical protein
MQEFDLLFNCCQKAFSHPKLWEKARELAFGALTCMGRHTITGMLSSSGQQFIDWSSVYRMFSQQRVDISKLYDVVRSNVLEQLMPHQPIVAHMDDTLLKKTGRHVPGTAWRRDPLGPAFHTNFIWGQRFLQISLALSDHNCCAQSRAIPVDFHHCPTVKRPGKSADEHKWKQYKQEQQIAKLSSQGSQRIKDLRDKLDKQGASHRQLIISVDGSYTNKQVLQNLPDRVTMIGRIRKDTKLYELPEKQTALGRKRVYGERLPTPEKIRQSEQYPWIQVNAWAAGKDHTFNVKIVKHTRWRPAGEKHTLQLVVIKPLRYRLTKNSKLMYRRPAYLICTDPDLDIEKLLQYYLWRWEIEVNFKEEKSLLGCGQAQVRNPESAVSVPAFIAALYAMLHIANYKSLKTSNQQALPRPKWYKKQKDKRDTSGDLINNLRAQLWTKAIGIDFSSFVNVELKTQKLKNKANPNTSATFYMRN